MKYKGFTNRVELLRAVADSIELQLEAGVNVPMCKFRGQVVEIAVMYLSSNFGEYELPLHAIAEKPVFEGDVMCLNSERMVTIKKRESEYHLLCEDENGFNSQIHIGRLTWDMPAKTITVVFDERDIERVIHALKRYNVPVAMGRAINAVKSAIGE